MTWDELQRLVQAGESETLEFKKSSALLGRACETLCGFLNGKGGTLLLEMWGRGTSRVIEQCRAAGIPPPEFSQVMGFTVVTFRVPVRDGAPEAATTEVGEQVTPQVTPQVERLLRACDGETLREELQGRAEITDRKYFRTAFIRPALDAGLLEMTIPDKPNSRLQKYRLTVTSRQFWVG